MRTSIWLALTLTVLPLSAQRNEPIGEPGKFDYYLLSLSWSPAYCASRESNANDPQCAQERHFAFVLHGLWPQYDDGRWPQFCSQKPGPPDPRPMLDIMPSPKLVRHEWEKHGTCSGLDVSGYFGLARKAFNNIRIPARFQNPTQYVTIGPGEVKREFLAANPGFSPDSIAIQCSSNYLSEVRICMNKDLRPTPCRHQRECRASSVRMPPVR